MFFGVLLCWVIFFVLFSKCLYSSMCICGFGCVGGSISKFSRVARRRFVKDRLDERHGFCSVSEMKRLMDSFFGHCFSRVTVTGDLKAVGGEVFREEAGGLEGGVDLEVLSRFDSLYMRLVRILDDASVDVDKRINAGKAAAGVLKDRFDVFLVIRKHGGGVVSPVGVVGDVVGVGDDVGSLFCDSVVSVPVVSGKPRINVHGSVRSFGEVVDGEDVESEGEVVE